jgi:signal transduction histidine kinase
MNRAFLDKLIGRIGRLQPDDLQGYLADLAREMGFLETLFNALLEGVIVVDREGCVLSINHAAGGFFGVDPAAALGKPLGEAIRGLDWPSLPQAGAVVNRDLEVFYPENRLLNFYIVPLFETPGGQQLASALILRDITETRKATEETIESERFSALTLLAAGVAHEVGNPLNSLDIHLQLIQRRVRKLSAKARAELEEAVAVTRQEVARLDHIITQFLRAIRHQAPTLRQGSLNAVVEETLGFLGPEIRDRDVLVETELDPGLPSVEMDHDQIKQALFNIVRNAIQAMRTGGILRVRTGGDEEGVFVRFADSGGGIAPEVIGRIFEPYFTTKQGGSGLGLFIVRRIVRAHGGELSLESAPGKGLTLTIRLPRADRRVRLLESGSPDAG